MSTIPALPPAPLPSDTPEQFNSKAFTFVAALDPWGDAVDVVAGEVAANSAAAVAAAVSTAADALSADADAATATAQAGIATTKASEASSSASSAAASAAAAAASLDNFDDRYLGSKANPPTVDNDGNTLVTGALYYNDGTVLLDNKGMWIWDGVQWIKASAATQAILVTYEYLATAGQTTFSGNDANGVPLAYTVGSIIVSLNGVKLRPGNDFTASNGSSVVLATGAASGDDLVIDAFSTFDVANMYTKAEVDGFAVKLTGAQSIAGTKVFTDNLGLGVTPSAWGGSSRGVIDLGIAGAVMASTSVGTATAYNAYFNGTDWIYKTSAGSTRYTSTSTHHAWYTAPSGTAGNAISFTQAMTLDSSGNLLVGTTSVVNTCKYVFAWDGASTNGVTFSDAYTGGATATPIYFRRNGSNVGSITTTSTSTAYNTTSDHRLKTNVRPANAARFMDIEFVDFEWVDGRHDCGTIAHQLASVYPDLVVGKKDATEIRTVEITPAVPAVLDEEGNEVTPEIPAVTEEQVFPVYQQVNYTGLIGRMGTRVQQLQRTVDALEARLAALEAK